MRSSAVADGGFATMMHVHNSSAHVLCTLAQRSRRAQHLPGLASAKNIGVFLLSEPHAGSDTASIRTSAKRDGQHYVINGSKQCISNGKRSGFRLVVAATGEPGPGIDSACSLLIPKIRAIRYFVSRTSSDSTPRIPPRFSWTTCAFQSAIWWEKKGEDMQKALSPLSQDGRIAIAALAIGVARAALEAAIRYAKDREPYGKPIRHSRQSALIWPTWRCRLRWLDST